MPKIFKDKDNNVLYTGYETNEVVANPTLAGTEATLTGLQVGDTKYALPQVPHLYQHTVSVTYREIKDEDNQGSYNATYNLVYFSVDATPITTMDQVHSILLKYINKEAQFILDARSTTYNHTTDEESLIIWIGYDDEDEVFLIENTNQETLVADASKVASDDICDYVGQIF